MIPTLLAFFAPITVAWLCLAQFRLAQCHPQPTQSRFGAVVYRGSLACGLGLGLSSCIFFLWLKFGRDHISSYWVFEAACAAVLLAACCQLRRLNPASSNRNQPDGALSLKADGAPLRWLAVSVALMAAGLTAVFVANQLRYPEGFNDAIGIWNLHARILLLDPNWVEFFSETWMWSHTDYPLLIPASVARLWFVTARPGGLAPGLIAYAYTVATIGVCAGYVATRRGSESGLFCALALLGTSFLIKHGSNQYADVPLAFYVAAALSLMSQHFAVERSGRTPSRETLVLAGLLAALAGWTKNEGLLFLACFFAVLTVTSLARTRFTGDIRRGVSSVLTAALGASGIVLLIVYFKSAIAPENDLIAGQAASEFFTRILDPHRYKTVISITLLELADVAKVMLPALAVFAVAVGRDRGTGQRLDVWIWTAPLLMVAGGYLCVYITTPHPLEWHLYSSVRRLFLQLWPAAVSGLFLQLAIPQRLLEAQADTAIGSTAHRRADSGEVTALATESHAVPVPEAS